LKLADLTGVAGCHLSGLFAGVVSVTALVVEGFPLAVSLAGLTRVQGQVEITFNDQLCATEAEDFANRFSLRPSIVSDNYGFCS
jgi:hypothetical protein